MHTSGRFARLAERWLPVAIVAFLAVFAWRFADERLYSDSGYYLAWVINGEGFHIEHGRWVLALSQMLPLIGVKLGVSMKGLILLHSLNNVLWLGACVLFASRVLRDRPAVITLACVHLIGLTHGLFCPIFELYYGVDLLILFHAVYRSDRLSSGWRWILLVVFFVGALSSHFFALVLAAGLLAVERIWLDRRTMIVFASLVVIHLLVRWLTLSAYETDGLVSLIGAMNSANIAYLLSPSHLLELCAYAMRHYLDVIVFAVAAIVVLLRSHQRRTAMFFTVVALLLLALCILYRSGSIHDRYREQVNFALVAWVIVMFCMQVLPLARWRTMAFAMLIAASLFRMVRAEWIAPWYAERTALVRAQIELTHAHQLSKAIVRSPVYFGPPHHLIDLSWSTSVESLLLSAKAGPQATVSLITSEDLEAPGVREHLDSFIFRRWDILDPSWLNAHYFDAPTGRYVLLTGDPR